MADRLRAEISLQHRIAETGRGAAPARASARSRRFEKDYRSRLHLAERVRAAPPAPLSAESFLRQYGLSTPRE
jgi:hypothetical protein